MRRLLLALLICLVPLQSFAGLVMNAKMAGMEVMMESQADTTNASQAPCHEVSQPVAAESQDCCGLQGVCHAMCHIVIAPAQTQPLAAGTVALHLAATLSTAFTSADRGLGFKPPLL